MDSSSPQAREGSGSQEPVAQPVAPVSQALVVNKAEPRKLHHHHTNFISLADEYPASWPYDTDEEGLTAEEKLARFNAWIDWHNQQLKESFWSSSDLPPRKQHSKASVIRGLVESVPELADLAEIYGGPTTISWSNGDQMSWVEKRNRNGTIDILYMHPSKPL